MSRTDEDDPAVATEEQFETLRRFVDEWFATLRDFNIDLNEQLINGGQRAASPIPVRPMPGRHGSWPDELSAIWLLCDVPVECVNHQNIFHVLEGVDDAGGVYQSHGTPGDWQCRLLQAVHPARVPAPGDRKGVQPGAEDNGAKKPATLPGDACPWPAM